MARLELNPKQRRIVAEHVARLDQVIDELPELMKPDLISLYQRYYTEEEFGALIEFYQTPVGQKVIANTTAITQETGHLIRALMAKLQPRLHHRSGLEGFCDRQVLNAKKQ